MKKAWLLIILLLFQSLSVFIPTVYSDSDNWVIDGDKVFIDDDNVFLSAEPHTVVESTWVEFTLISKQYTGDIDVVWGFNHSVVRPEQPQRWNGTAYNDWSKEFIVKNLEFKGCNKWYILTELPIIKDVEYKVRAWMNLQFNTSGKYWFAVKPSGETLQQAIDSGHLYYLDPWWNTTYNYKIKITIESDYIDVSLIDFPLLVVVNSTISSKCDMGRSIRFTDNDVDLLSHEIENGSVNWDNSTDNFVWVKIGTISDSSDTVFYMYYNNTDVSDASDPASVWSDYEGVWHMNDSTTSLVSDVTGNGHTGNKTGADNPLGRSYGIAGACQVVSTDTVNVGDFDLGTNDYTFEYWVYHTDITDTISFFYRYPDANNNEYCLKSAGSSAYLHQRMRSGGTDARVELTSGSMYWQTGVWDYISFVGDRDFSGYIFRNGTSLSLDTNTMSTYDVQITDTIELNRDDFGSVLIGRIDEVRICYIARYEPWISATYHNINQSTHLGPFLTWGSEITRLLQITDVYPSNGSTQIELNPELNVTVSNPYGVMNISWYHNNTGDTTWTLIGTNTTVGNGSYSQTTTGMFDDPATTYYWRIELDNGTGWLNESYYFTTWTYPLPPSDVTTSYAPPNLTINWTKHGDRTVVVRNNNSVPSSVTDGVEYYNDTGTEFTDTDVTGTAYFKLWSYNTTNSVYSLTGTLASWGGLEVNAYNESDNTSISNWDLFITNESGSETYYNTSNNNPHRINLTVLPTGTNIAIKVSATDYSTRYYYMDLNANQFYTLNAFLPPDNDSELYLFSVLDEIDQPVADAKMEIRQYINKTVGYTNVSVLFTDGNGQVSLYLLNDTIYKVVITKTGYQNETADFIPDPEIRTYTFRLEYEEITPPAPYVESEEITFDGYISGTTLYVNFTDNLAQTIDSQIYVYVVSYSTGVTSLFDSDSRTGDSDYQVSFTGINRSNAYWVYLFYNHTTFGYNTHTMFFEAANITTITTPSIGDALFDANYGYCPFGWTNLFMFLFLLACFFSFGQRGSGISLIFTGGLVLLLNYIIGFNTVLSVAAGGAIPVLFIILGVMVLWRDSKKEASS